MSKKYVIEIKPEYEDSFNCLMLLGAKDSNLFVDALAVENLEQYTPVDVEKIYDKAYGDGYNKGLKDGKQTAVGAAELREKLEYQKGFKDGKAINEKGCEGCKYQANRELTCPCSECANNYKNQWTADKIEVGDEAKTQKGIIFVVTKVTADNLAVGFTNNGSNCIFEVDRVVKTGRHFDIASILEEMRHD